MNQASVWSLAGHDPFAGAGIQADMRVAAALHTPLRTLITSMTAQNDKKLFAAEAVSLPWLSQQWQALSAMEVAGAYKVGLLLKSETVRWLAAVLVPDVPLILDPVFQSSSGAQFIDQDLLENLREFLFPRVDLLTPNRPEAEAIVGFPISSEDDMRRAAEHIRAQGVKAVLIKGGHCEGERILDYFDAGQGGFFLEGLRRPGAYRGTGCALSTAIACYLSQGLDLRDAVVAAHSYVQLAIADAHALGHKHLGAATGVAPLSPLHRHDTRVKRPFAFLTRTLGFYPVLPNVGWIKRIAESGVATVQLRIKDQSGAELRSSILEAKAICEAHNIALFINDAWQLAIECQVYGVHLGQEDLDTLSPDELESIRTAGLRLGISTHSLEEAARALALKPSYIALGPVFETQSKPMRFGPQGLARIGEWVKRLPHIPIVAIGGLKLEHAAAVKLQGADSLAVISDLTESAHPEQRMNDWLNAWGA